MNEQITSEPLGEYKVVNSDSQWHVVWAPRANPHWWRWIGTFASFAHADDFAEQNNVLTEEDWGDMDNWPLQGTVEHETPPLEIPTIEHDKPAPPEVSAREPEYSKLTGRAKDAYDLLCLYADENKELPVTRSLFMVEANIPKGSAGYVNDQLEMLGFVEWLTPDDGRWGAHLMDGQEIYGPFPKASAKIEQHEDEPGSETYTEPKPRASPVEKPVKMSDKQIDTWLFIHRAQSDGPVRMASVIEYFGIARTPAQRRVQRLHKGGYIKSIGAGRATQYVTAMLPPGVTLEESPVPELAPPEPEPESEPEPAPVNEPGPPASEQQISVAREAARWMQSIGYPVKDRNYGNDWSCKGIENLMSCETLVKWVNKKRAEQNLPLFEFGD